MNDEHGFDHTFGNQDGKYQEMQAHQGFRQAFVISRQPAKIGQPGKGPLGNVMAVKLEAILWLSFTIELNTYY
jgi:hypothetical protein